MNAVYGTSRLNGSNLPDVKWPRRATMGLWTSWISELLPIPE